MYDNNNIFAKIIRNEISCDKIFEDDRALFFNDINPKAKIHILGLPKAKVISLSDFIIQSSEIDFKYFFQKIFEVVKKFKLNKTGYRLITNDGKNANQEVPHFHVHILGGNNLGDEFFE
tara:strand:+ start:1081 stop:1437 length:357 start_codon:yes stop_codon:yes gene_type:complete